MSDPAWRGAWAGAHLCRARRPDMDIGCRRASWVTRAPVCWRRAYVVNERRSSCAVPTGTWNLHENVLLGRRDILMVSNALR